MSRQTPVEQGHEKLGANKFGVATQGNPIATRTRLLNTNYVVTLSNTCSDDLLGLLACICDQAQYVPRVSRSHVVKKMPN